MEIVFLKISVMKSFGHQKFRPRKILVNKTQYDWFPVKSQDSKKFSAKFQQNQTTSKNHRFFKHFLGLKYTQGVTTLLGVKISSKMDSAPSNYLECKFSAKSDNFYPRMSKGGGHFDPTIFSKSNNFLFGFFCAPFF